MSNSTLVLGYDTETTGLPLFRERSHDPRQPHLVQLGASLIDAETYEVVAGIDVIIRPNGWEIPEETSNIHGITTEKAADCGVDEALALAMFLDLWAAADFRLGHNEQFDARIMRIAMARYIGQEDVSDRWKQGAAKCTANMATGYCQLPPTEKMVKAGFNRHKTPTLQEAYRHFYGEDFAGAHTAMADVNACIDVYRAIQDLETTKEEVLA